LPEVSWLTVAVKEAEPPAGTDVELAETETVIGGGVLVTELLLPPQPALIAAKVNPTTDKARDAARFICASA
jgi:hypothetical protein